MLWHWTARGLALAGLAWTVAAALPLAALAQNCPLAAVADGSVGPLLQNRGTLVRTDGPAAVAWRSGVEIDYDGAPDAYHRGLPSGPGPDPGLDHICNGASVLEERGGQLVDKFPGGQNSGQCKRDYIALRDAGFPACAPGKLCMLWFGIRSEPRRCGFDRPNDMRCGVPILQEGREFYLTTTSLRRPGASAESRAQSDYVDAAKVPYLVMPGRLELPSGLQWQVGDLGVMLFNGKVVYVVVGDTGPTTKIGEASLAALRGLRGNGSTIEASNPATTLIFPGSRDLILDQWPLDPQRIRAEGEKLVAKMGGAAALARCPGFTGFQ